MTESHVPNTVRQVRAGMYGVVTHEDRHVSEPVDPLLVEIAEGLLTLEYAERLEALVTLAEDGYDTELLERLVYQARVRRTTRAAGR